MRGYFAMGVEGISKPMNMGNLLRSSHAFGASYFFTISPAFPARQVRLSDTSDAGHHLPVFTYDRVEDLNLPRSCHLVGVELTDEAIALPSFRHPLAAAYVLGPERGSLSPALQARCQFIVKIPMKFCVNVGVAGAILMYDRMISLNRFGPRASMPGGPREERPAHHHGSPTLRNLDAFLKQSAEKD